MNLSCLITVDDLMVGYEHVLDTSRHLQRQLRKQAVRTSLLLVAILGVQIVALLASNISIKTIGIISVPFVPVLLALPSGSRDGSRAVAQQHFENLLGITLESREYLIEERGFRAMTPVYEELIYWSAITDIVAKTQHCLVMIGEVGFQVIPMKRVSAGDYNDFVRELRDQWTRSTNR